MAFQSARGTVWEVAVQTVAALCWHLTATWLSGKRFYFALWPDRKDNPRSPRCRLVQAAFVCLAARHPEMVGVPVYWVPEGSLAGILWVGFWSLGGPWGL